MYIYENHMGGLYTSDRELSWEETHCEMCGDSDWLIGYATTKEEAWELLKDDTDIDGCGGWDYEYVMEFLKDNWDDVDTDKFEEYAHFGFCDVCGKHTNVVVCASAFGGVSYAYCQDCLSNYLEPYDAMVAYISCAGLFPDDINEAYQELCRHILKGLGISEEKFIEDVKKTNEDFYEFMNEQELCDGFAFDEEDFVEDKPTDRYMKFDCPECGAPLEVLADYLIEERPAEFDSFKYERRNLIRHCYKCHCDWENEWWTEFGDVGESQLKRKFWG